MIYLDYPNFLPPQQLDRIEPVNYQLNSHLYRTQEWDTIDWKKSIVLFGCSNTFGIGLEESETISFQLEKQLSRPVINLGSPGSSIYFSFYNSLILKKYYPTPYAVIHLWTSQFRLSYFADDNQIVHVGAWGDKYPMFKEWIKFPNNSLNHDVPLAYVSQLIWDNTKYFHASFFKETASLLNCYKLEQIDNARDLIHPGPKTASLVADQIAGYLINGT